MKRLLALSIILFSFTLVVSQTNQSWNPYLNQGIISPAPILPLELNGQGIASFNVGNTGSSILPLVSGDELKVEVILSNGVPNGPNPLLVISGSGVSYFNWSYNSTTKKYLGIQNQPIPSLFFGTVIIEYLVTLNTALSNAGNGFEAKLFPPLYALNINTTDDDGVSSYTYVRARDFGDAPSSYGMARADIDYFRDFNGDYEWLVFLGDTIDQENNFQYSEFADADNNEGINDEDGVIFPSFLIPGTTISLPITLKVLGGYGFLNAWIDWNSNGVFDTNEQIINNTFVFNSQTIDVSVNVPSDAVLGSTFARFRFGEVAGPTGLSLYGEVEDYLVIINTPTLSIVLEKSGTYNDIEPIGVYNAGDQILYSFSILNNGNVPLSNIVLTDPKVSIIGGPITILNPGQEDNSTYSATYVLTQNDIDLGSFTNTAEVKGYYNSLEAIDEDDDVQVFLQTPLIKLVKSSELINGFVPNPFEYSTPGDEITYNFNVTNTGNVTLSQVAVNDVLTGSINLLINPSTLLPGQTGIAIATYSVNQADLDLGKVINIATVTGSFNGQNVIDIDSALVFGNQQPNIRIEKSSTTIPNYFNRVGDTLTYTLITSNIGNVTLHNINVSDPDAIIVGSPSTTLSPGQKDTLIAFYLVTQLDINNEQFVNIASTSGEHTNPNGQLIIVNDEDDEIVYSKFPDLTPIVTVIVNAMKGITEFYIFVKVTELNGAKTNSPIIVTIPKDNRVIYRQPFNTNLQELYDIPLNNSVWSYSEDSTNHIFTTASIIDANEYSNIGMIAEFNPEFAKGFYTLTSQIASGSGGELRINNNVDAEKINFFIK